MKRLFFAMLCMAAAFVSLPAISSGPCDCECLAAAARDPLTDSGDVQLLLQAMDDYGCNE